MTWPPQPQPTPPSSWWSLRSIGRQLAGLFRRDDQIQGQIAEVKSLLQLFQQQAIAMLRQLDTKAGKLMSVYDDLLGQVTVITQLKPAIITFINGQNAKMDDLKAQIAALQGAGAPDAETLAKLTSAVDELKGDGAEIAAAIVQGTPADAGGATGGDQSGAPTA